MDLALVSFDLGKIHFAAGENHDDLPSLKVLGRVRLVERAEDGHFVDAPFAGRGVVRMDMAVITAMVMAIIIPMPSAMHRTARDHADADRDENDRKDKTEKRDAGEGAQTDEY